MANHGNLYGVFMEFPDAMQPRNGKWALTTNKRQALKTAKAWAGYVMVIKGGNTGAWSNTSWDAPTFKYQADMVADYREGNK